MKSKAHKAIAEAAAAIGITEVREESNVAIADYEGAAIRISRDMSTSAPAWNVVIDGVHEAIKRSPSIAFKHAVNVIDLRLRVKAADEAVDAAAEAAGAAGATIGCSMPGRILADYKGRLVDVVLENGNWVAYTREHLGGEYPACVASTPARALTGAIKGLREILAAKAVPASKEETLDDLPSPLGTIEYVVDTIDGAERLLITDLAEVREALNDGFAMGVVDHTSEADELREFYNIGEEVADVEILDLLGDVVKYDAAPLLVLTFGSDTVAVCVEVGDSDSEEALADGLAAAGRELSDVAGYEVTMEQVSNDEEGDGVLVAYRAPRGDFSAGDVEDVQRFGVEVGRYRMRTEDEAMLARLETALEGQSHEEATVKDGVAKVVFFDAPGTPEGWAVGLTTTRSRVVAQFDHEDGRAEEVAWEPAEPEMQTLAFDHFLRDPASWSADLWEIVESRRQAA